MTKLGTFSIGALALAVLSGCVEDTGAMAPMPPAPGSPPFITSMSPDVSPQAIAACRSALDATTDGLVSVVGGETSQAATAIYMRVGANGAPWRCLVAPNGSNPDLMFMGDEGYL